MNIKAIKKGIKELIEAVESGQADEGTALEYREGYEARAKGEPCDLTWSLAKTAGWHHALADDAVDRTVLAWNTGVRYSPKGQRMGALRIAPDRIAFIDRDRKVSGVIRIDSATTKGLRELVMEAYKEDLIDSGLEGPELSKVAKILEKITESV